MTPSEIKRTETTRSKALVVGLAGHLGKATAHSFAVAYDRRTGSDTKESKRWRAYFKGQQALPQKTVHELANLFPCYPVTQMYRNGPGGLWQALWADLEDVRRGILASDLSTFEDFSQAMHEFESDILLMNAYGLLESELSTLHLAKAVAYFRLQHGLFGLDSSGLSLIIRECLTSRIVQTELLMYDALEDVRNALATGDTLPANISSHRWEALSKRLTWVT